MNKPTHRRAKKPYYMAPRRHQTNTQHLRHFGNEKEHAAPRWRYEENALINKPLVRNYVIPLTATPDKLVRMINELPGTKLLYFDGVPNGVTCLEVLSVHFGLDHSSHTVTKTALVLVRTEQMLNS